MVKRIILPYLECRLESRGKEKTIYIDSYFTKIVMPINVSLLIYPYSIVNKYIIKGFTEEDIVLRSNENCESLLRYVIEVYQELKSNSLRIFKRMYWYNVSNLLVPVRFSPVTRDKIGRYEKLVGELTASAMLLDRVLGKSILRGDYVVGSESVNYIRLYVSRGDGGIIFSDGILGKVYTKLYEVDEKFREELIKIIGL